MNNSKRVKCYIKNGGSSKGCLPDCVHTEIEIRRLSVGQGGVDFSEQKLFIAEFFIARLNYKDSH